MRVRGFIGARTHRKLFLAFAAAITLASVAMVGVFVLLEGGMPPGRELRRVERFASHLFENVWDDPVRREQLAHTLANDLEANVVLREVDGREITFVQVGEGEGHVLRVPILQHGYMVGRLDVQLAHSKRRHGLGTFLLSFGAALFVLWVLAGFVARRMARSLRELTRVAGELGAGRLESRARLRHGTSGEVGELTRAINDMATRIEHQLKSQKELLAAVSHELRTPLSRIRLLVDIGRENPNRTDIAEQIESEVVEMDALVGELLAGARVEFGTLNLTSLDVADVARRAWDRAAIANGELQVADGVGSMTADATLISRALSSLLDNAKKHGGDRVNLRVTATDRNVRFEVEDNGQGFVAGEEERVFAPFYQGRSRADGEARGIGLGLSLVRRIAEAHRGRASAKNGPAGGACVAIEIPRQPSAR